MVWSGRFRVSLASTGTHQARWLLLRNLENLRRPEQRIHLQDLLNANRKLMTVYLRRPSSRRYGRQATPGSGERPGGNGSGMPRKARSPH